MKLLTSFDAELLEQKANRLFNKISENNGCVYTCDYSVKQDLHCFLVVWYYEDTLDSDESDGDDRVDEDRFYPNCSQ